jgi:hypothetical protein
MKITIFWGITPCSPWRRHAPLNELHGVIPQKTVLFNTWVHRVSSFIDSNRSRDFDVVQIFFWSRDRSVGIVTGYGLDDRGGGGVAGPGGETIFTSTYPTDRPRGPPNLPIKWVPG